MISKNIRKFTLPKFQFRIFILLIFSLITTLSCLICLFWVSEHWFFDQIFYKKSAFHGYMNQWFHDASANKTNWFEKIITVERERDIRYLISGKEFPKTNSQTKTVAIIGDSLTYGLGVLSHQRYSNILANKLQKNGFNTKVYNFSDPGNSIVEAYALYQLVKKQLDPDLIIIAIVNNDLLLNDPRYPGEIELIRKLDKTCPQPIFQDKTETDRTHTFHYYAQLSFSPAFRNRCYLEKIAQDMSQDEKVIFFSFDSVDETPWCGSLDPTMSQNTAPEYQEATQEYISILNQTNNSVYSFKSETKIDNNSVSKAELHPSHQKHDLYAQYLSQIITQKFE